MRKQIIIGKRIGNPNGHNFIKKSNNFFALYNGQIYVGNCLTRKEALSYLK